MSINLSAVAVFGLNFAMRWDDPARLGSTVLTVLGIVLIGVSGWLGGEMVYRGGVGVAPEAATTKAEAMEREPVASRPVGARTR
jgi:uncharacterized membrane protein